jgi:hypothetical protein
MSHIAINKGYILIYVLRGKWKRGVTMRKIAALLPTVLLVMLASTAYSQSLADLANREKERREEVKNEKVIVITEEEAAKYRSKSETMAITDQPSGKEDSDDKEKSETATQSGSEKPDLDEPVDFEGRPESFWRKTMAEARQRVKNLENEANVLVLKLNDLQMQFYREDDGFKREGIQREMQKTFYEQDLNKENLAKAKDALQDLENEARKSGALPGWIAAKNP